MSQGRMGVEGIRERVGDLDAQALKNSKLRKAGSKKVDGRYGGAGQLPGLRFEV